MRHIRPKSNANLCVLFFGLYHGVFNPYVLIINNLFFGKLIVWIHCQWYELANMSIYDLPGTAH